jgi:hypothetical protein
MYTGRTVPEGIGGFSADHNRTPQPKSPAQEPNSTGSETRRAKRRGLFLFKQPGNIIPYFTGIRPKKLAFILSRYCPIPGIAIK